VGESGEGGAVWVVGMKLGIAFYIEQSVCVLSLYLLRNRRLQLNLQDKTVTDQHPSPINLEA
jgi:hypothetical protein